MRQAWPFPVVLACLTLGAASAPAQDVRYFDSGGVRYCEYRDKVRAPVSDTVWEDQQQTVYREQLTTELHDSHSTIYTPVVVQNYRPVWHGRYNPFVQPYMTLEPAPYTYWSPQTLTTKVPVTSRQWVPEARTVKVPVRTLRFVEQDQVRVVAVGPAPREVIATQPSAAAPVATGLPLGGVSRLESDPPRIPSGFPATGGTIRR